MYTVEPLLLNLNALEGGGGGVNDIRALGIWTQAANGKGESNKKEGFGCR